MDKAYNPSNEENIYKLWEDAGSFTPVVPQNPVQARLEKEPFTIILPPPNANDPLHAGHALYVVEDIMVRYHRMLGDPTLWLPGTDHAGIETQFVYEKKLKKEGKSRFDFDRQTLRLHIHDFRPENICDLHDLRTCLRIHPHLDQHQLPADRFTRPEILHLDHIRQFI